MEASGYRAGLQFADVDWLLGDGLTRDAHDRRLAVNSALALQRSADAPTTLLDKIAAAASTDTVAREAYDTWVRRRQAPLELTEMERRLKKMESRNASERAKRDQSWLDFIRELKTDPARIARLKTPPASGVN